MYGHVSVRSKPFTVKSIIFFFSQDVKLLIKLMDLLPQWPSLFVRGPCGTQGKFLQSQDPAVTRLTMECLKQNCLHRQLLYTRV